MAAHSVTACVLLACVVLALVVPFGHSQDVTSVQRALRKRLERMPSVDEPFAPASNVVRLADAVAAGAPTPNPTPGPATPAPGPGTPMPTPTPDSPGSSASSYTSGSPLYSSAYYDSPTQYGGDLWYQHYWFWALVALVFLACTGLILACVVKSCLCQKKKSMKYIAPTKTYGTNTPVTDKHRAEMEAKYGKFSAY